MSQGGREFAAGITTFILTGIGVIFLVASNIQNQDILIGFAFFFGIPTFLITRFLLKGKGYDYSS